MINPTITLADELDPATRESICAPLRQYNRAQNPDFFTKRDLPEHAPRPLNLIARDASGRIFGGLLAATQFTWLKIDILAIAPDFRGQDIGTRLMQAAEAGALSRGCTYVYVDTMSYQAPKFYEKLGYTLAGKFEDWDSHGHTKYEFTKLLKP